MSIVVIEKEDQFDCLQREWTALLRESAADTVFLSFDWARAWWSAYADRRLLRIIRISRDGTLLALVPLYLQELTRYGLRYVEARLIGDGSSDSDYLDLIVRKGSEPEVARAFSDFIGSPALRCDALLLSDVPRSSPNLKPLAQSLAERGWTWRETTVPSAFVDLPRDWDTYLKRLAPRMRTKIRSTTKALERDFTVRYERCEAPQDLPDRLGDLYRLHATRWSARDQPGVFDSPSKRKFYREMSSRFLNNGWLRFYSLLLNDRYVAQQFCFEYDNTMFLLQEGFDPDLEKQAVGNVLRAHVFRDCIERGVSTYDFLGGVTPHKLSWGSAVKENVRVATGGPGLKNALYFGVPRGVEAAKRSIKAIVPDRVLALRNRLG